MMKHVTQHAYFSISEISDNYDNEVFEQDEPEPPQKNE